MMQRDETRLLDAWFQYHGYLFGFENLVVFDNGSTQPKVVEKLRRYERAGSMILWHHKTDEAFEARRMHFETAVNGWDGDDYDLAITLEAGEFLALFTRDGLSCRREDIDAYCERLRGTAERFEIGFAFTHVPAFPGFYFGQTTSRIFTAAPIADSDGHRWHAASGSPARSTELACVRCDPVPPSLTPSARAEARHRVAGTVLVGLPSFASLADILGIDAGLFGTVSGDLDRTELRAHPFLPTARPHHRRTAAVFDGGTYLRLNPDVAASSWPALKHFLIHGYSEDRLYVTVETP